MRNSVIDILRGFSILFVILAHVQIRIPFDQTDTFASLPNCIWSFLFKSGNDGVRIFFVLSGFLITSTSLERWGELQNINIRQFYRIRFARIAPCLIVLLVILSILHFLKIDNYTINTERVSYLQALFSALTFHLNWLEGQYGYLPGSWDILWSLSVEEVFYLFFPILCLTFRTKWLPYIFLTSLIVIGPLNRILLADNNIWQSKAYLSCMDSIALGCLTALFTNKYKVPKTISQLFMIIGSVSILILLLIKKEESFKTVISLGMDKTLLSFSVAFIIIASIGISMPKILKRLFFPIAEYGKLSYEVYLTHMFIVFSGVTLYKKTNSTIDSAWIWLVGIVLIAGLISFLIERFYSSVWNRKFRGISKIQL